MHIPLVTPFDDDGDVDYAALERLARDCVDAGATALVALGTTGEPSALTPAERRDVVTVLAAAGVGVLVGANDADALRRLAGRPGVAGALTLVPPFLRPGEDGVVAHLSALASVSPVPMVVYHVPYRTGQPLSAATIRRIASIPGVCGMKLAAGGVDAETVDLLADPPAGFEILCGDDAFVSPLLALGAHGAVVASAQVLPAAYARLVDLWGKGDVVAARELGGRLARLSAALFAEPNPTVIKGVLYAQGRIRTPGVRLPLLPASATSVEAAVALVRELSGGWGPGRC